MFHNQVFGHQEDRLLRGLLILVAFLPPAFFIWRLVLGPVPIGALHDVHTIAIRCVQAVDVVSQ